jgi:hypothetical protein
MLMILCFVLLQTPVTGLSPEAEAQAQLAKVRRVYVDILTGGDAALQIRDLLMTSLQKSKLFIITEDEEKADAVLKGAAGDETFIDLFQSSDNINAHSQIGGGVNGNSRNSGSRYAGLSIGENETRRTEERKHEAIATVRLVSKDGDVIWSATAESLGGKFLGASADVADKIAKRLAVDFNLAKGKIKPGQSGASSK